MVVSRLWRKHLQIWIVNKLTQLMYSTGNVSPGEIMSESLAILWNLMKTA